jgi:anti-sigma28 factor (negative regulator of flagellin synthesis)
MTIDRVGPLNKILKAGSDINVKKNSRSSKKDSVELSPEAKKMAEISQADSQVKSASDIRQELTPQRIKALRSKLENPDDYLTKEIAAAIAEKVAESFGIR